MLPRGLEHDVEIDGVYHYSHLDVDLCRLIWFRRSLRKWPEKSFVLDCFPEQVPYLKEYLGDYWEKAEQQIKENIAYDILVQELPLESLWNVFCELCSPRAAAAKRIFESKLH